MTNMQSDIVALLRADFGEEAEAGFPHLRRIPQTKVVQFLDYFARNGHPRSLRRIFGSVGRCDAYTRFCNFALS